MWDSGRGVSGVGVSVGGWYAKGRVKPPGWWDDGGRRNVG